MARSVSISDVSPHAAGFQRTIAVLYDSDLTRICQTSLVGDQVSVSILSESDGRDYLFALLDTTDVGSYLTQSQELFCISAEGWTPRPLSEDWASEVQPEDLSRSYATSYCVLQGDRLFIFQLHGEKNAQSYYDHTYSYQHTLVWDSQSAAFKEAES